MEVSKKEIDELMEYLDIDSPPNKPIVLRFEDKTSLAVFLKDMIERARKDSQSHGKVKA